MKDLKEYIDRFHLTIIEMEEAKAFYIKNKDYITAGIYKEKISMARNILQDLKSLVKE